MTAPTTGTRRVYLHVGAPKTGTTYLQDRLFSNVASLRKHGVLVPTAPWWSGRAELHFRAALDLLDQDWGGPPGHADGAWEQLVSQVKRHQGTVVVSHELLAPAPPEVVARVLRELGPGEVHIVYTARDPARLLPSAWQEAVKQGRGMRFAKFLKRARAGKVWFMQAFDLPSVLGSWGASLPPERLHVVTVPRSGSDPELLWRRFCQALQVDPGWGPAKPRRRNESMGIPETQLLRLLNRRLRKALPDRDYRHRHVVKNVIAQQALATRRSDPVRLPPKAHGWVTEMAERWVEWARTSGVDVVGDLDDLLPAVPDPDHGWVDPDRIRSRAFRDAALDALVAAVREAAEGQRHPLRRRAQKVARRVPGLSSRRRAG
ncbi:MAG TPA: hypothetical protein VGK60_03805 [Pedococcus sp.]